MCGPELHWNPQDVRQHQNYVAWFWPSMQSSPEVRTVVDAEDAHKGLSADIGVVAHELPCKRAPVPNRSAQETRGPKPIARAALCCVCAGLAENVPAPTTIEYLNEACFAPLS